MAVESEVVLETLSANFPMTVRRVSPATASVMVVAVSPVGGTKTIPLGSIWGGSGENQR